MNCLFAKSHLTHTPGSKQFYTTCQYSCGTKLLRCESTYCHTHHGRRPLPRGWPDHHQQDRPRHHHHQPLVRRAPTAFRSRKGPCRLPRRSLPGDVRGRQLPHRELAAGHRPVPQDSVRHEHSRRTVVPRDPGGSRGRLVDCRMAISQHMCVLLYYIVQCIKKKTVHIQNKKTGNTFFDNA